MLAALFLTICGCNKSDGVVVHGNLRYSAKEIFGDHTPAWLLATAAARGDVKEVNRQIAAGVDVNIVGKYGITPLWWAAFQPNFDGFDALLKKGASPNSQREERFPIMLLISEMKDSRFLEAALKHGGDPNLMDKNSGEPPLYPAVRNGFKRHIDLLLTAGANANWQDSLTGETLPMVAVGSSRDYELVYRLFQNGADPTLKDKGANTIADVIAIGSVNASNNNDPWKAKVLEILKIKGVIASKPAPK